MLVELQDCLFGYRGRPVVQVNGLDLDAGRCLGVFGPNGSGKTTLVRGMTGLLPPIAGKVIRPHDLRFGYIPQHRALELHWPMSGLDAAAMAISSHQRWGWLGGKAARLIPMLETLGVQDLARRPFAKLSGGQQQRLLLAGALAAEPQVLVLDEPTDGLDVRSRQILLDVLRRHAAQGLATVIISHDVEDLMCLCDQVAWVHPSQDPGQPSQVELIAPPQLAERVMVVRQASR